MRREDIGSREGDCPGIPGVCCHSIGARLFIITFVVQSFVVDGSSMEPTLHHGQRLLVNKFIYYFTRPQRGI